MFTNSRREKYFCLYLFIGIVYISEKNQWTTITHTIIHGPQKHDGG